MKFAPALSLGALTIGGAAWAQEAPTRRIDFGASAVTVYESNLLKLPDGTLLAPGRERDDVRFTPSLTVDVEVPLGRQSVFLSGQAGYDFYVNNEDLNRERIQLGGGGVVRLASCQNRLAVDFARQQSDLADILTGDRIANAETRWVFDTQLSCQTAGGLAPTAGYQHERVKNSDPLRQNGNYSADLYSAGIGYSRPWLGNISLNGSYRRGRYEDRPFEPLAPDRLDTYTANVRISREFGSQLTGFASLGWTKVDPKLPGVQDFKGLSWSADLTWNPGNRLQASFGASREAQQSNLLGISYAIVDDYRGDVVYALGDRIRLSAGANYTKRSLRDSPLTPGALLQEEDRSLRARAGASYVPSRRLSVSFDASSERRRSDNRLFDYDNFVVALTTKLIV